jgi:DNA-binding protein HU-beta
LSARKTLSPDWSRIDRHAFFLKQNTRLRGGCFFGDFDKKTLRFPADRLNSRGQRDSLDALCRDARGKDYAVNKADLISNVASEANLSKAQAAEAVDAVINSITSALGKGDEVKIAGFGTFAVANRAATQGRNPKTGAPIAIPATKLPKFKAGKALKDSVR